MFSPTEPRELTRVYLEHALAGRGVEAARTLIEAVIDDRIDLVDLFERVITPAAQQVGELWHQARITVADEHFVTQLNQELIAVAARLRPGPQSNAERIVLACPPDELHDTGLRMLAQLLTSHGYDVSMLGASTPIASLVDYVRKQQPLAVGLSIASPLAIGSLASTVTALREALGEITIFVGGRCTDAYPAVATAVGAPQCATTREALAFLASLPR